MKEAKYNLVYEIRNLVTGHIYVGAHSTDNFNDCYMGSGKNIKKAIQEFGGEKFVKTVLFFCSSSKEMYEKEAEIVNDVFLKRDDVYNVTLGGTGFQYGHVPSRELIDKLIARCKGKPMTEEHRRKLSLARIGKKLSPEHKRNIGLKSLGRKHTDTTLAKMRAVKLGGKHTEEARRNMSLAHVGIKMSDEAKRKLSEHFIGRRHSDESKQRMRIARFKVVERKRAEAQQEQ